MNRGRRYGVWAGGLLAALIISLIGYRLLQPSSQPTRGVAVSSALGGDDNAGYQRAYAPRPFRFPADHGPHPEFRNEWWYVTGNLADFPEIQRAGVDVCAPAEYLRRLTATGACPAAQRRPGAGLGVDLLSPAAGSE